MEQKIIKVGVEEKEIDLVELFVKMFLLFKYNIKAFLVIMLIGGLIGLSIGYLYPEKHKYQLVCFSPIVEVSLLEEIVGELKQPNFMNEVMSELPDSLMSEGNVAFSTIDFRTIESENNEMLSITFTSKDLFTPSLAELIVKQAVLKNDFVKEMLINEKNELKNVIGFLEQEIDRQKNIAEANDAKVVINSEESVAELYIKKEDYVKQLLLLRPVVFTKSTNTVLSEKQPVVITTLVGVFVGCLVLIMFFLLKYLNRASKDNSIVRKNLSLFSKTA